MSIVAGLLALLIGLYVIGKREKRYRAEAAVAITPVAAGRPGPAADALVAGDIVATFGQAFEGSLVVRSALTDAKISGPDRELTTVTTEPVPNSTVITVRATGPSKAVAEAAATAVASAKADIAGLSDVYESHIVRSAAGTGTRTGTSATVLRLEVLIVAVIVALLTAAVVRRIPPSGPPPAPASGAGESA